MTSTLFVGGLEFVDCADTTPSYKRRSNQRGRHNTQDVPAARCISCRPSPVLVSSLSVGKIALRRPTPHLPQIGDNNMCGIFGFIGPEDLDSTSAKFLVKHAQQRGRDSSGMVIRSTDAYRAYRADYPIEWLLKRIPPLGNLFFGHSRLVTNGTSDNQPVAREQIVVLHNGIIVNHEAIWPILGKSPELEIDTEVIPAIIASHLEHGGTIETAAARVLSLTEGVVACAALIPRLGKLLLFSNNGSLYVGDKTGGICSPPSGTRSSRSGPRTSVRCAAKASCSTSRRKKN